MAITIDKEACVGCGLCVNNCPDCFEMADDGIAIVKESGCTSCNPSEIAEQCPVDAIKVE
jgi:ferredoxin